MKYPCYVRITLSLLFLVCSACGGSGGGDESEGSAAVMISDRFNGSHAPFYGQWNGMWNSTEYPGSGYFSAKVGQNSSELGGVIDIPYIGLNEAELAVSINGSEIDFGDIDGQINFRGTVEGNRAWGNYNYQNGRDVGTWEAVR